MSNGNGSERSSAEAFELKVGLAEMMRNGVIMDVTNDEQARIAEDAGACAVMALERVPSDIRKDGGVSRMSAVEILRGPDHMAIRCVGIVDMGVYYIPLQTKGIRTMSMAQPMKLGRRSDEFKAKVRGRIGAPEGDCRTW